MKMLTIFLIIILCVTFSNCDDIFSSTADLNRLLQLESKFVADLNKFIEKLEFEARTIRTFLETQYGNNDFAQDTSNYVNNPINSLYLIKRLGKDLDRSNLSLLLASNETEILRQELHNLTVYSFPKESDYEGATTGIFWLQEYYNLNISKLSDGLIEYEDTQLTSDHMIGGEELYKIGVSTINSGFYDTGSNFD